jgi:DNA-directed RNA polymerase specialized sigma24 family protein
MLTLENLSELEREALRRYYLLDQGSEQVCRDLGLDQAEFLTLKNRVKKAFRAKLTP